MTFAPRTKVTPYRIVKQKREKKSGSLNDWLRTEELTSDMLHENKPILLWPLVVLFVWAAESIPELTPQKRVKVVHAPYGETFKIPLSMSLNCVGQTIHRYFFQYNRVL